MTRLTRNQVREIDRLSITQYHIPGVVLMENAARAVADAACELLGPRVGAEVLILCGGGNNGGDGLAAARHLHNRGKSIRIALTIDPAAYKGEALANWQIVQAMRLPTEAADPAKLAHCRCDLVIDAIFGTGLTKPPRQPFDQIVAGVERVLAPVLAVDIPSGLDCDTGQPLGACVHATRTVTFVAEKSGFAAPNARPYLGQVTVADIGSPRELVETVVAGDGMIRGGE